MGVHRVIQPTRRGPGSEAIILRRPDSDRNIRVKNTVHHRPRLNSRARVESEGSGPAWERAGYWDIYLGVEILAMAVTISHIMEVGVRSGEEEVGVTPIFNSPRLLLGLLEAAIPVQARERLQVSEERNVDKKLR